MLGALWVAMACGASLPPAGPAMESGAETQVLPLAARTPSIDPEVALAPPSLVCPEVKPDASTLRFGESEEGLSCARRGICRPHRRLVDSSAAELVAFLGTPTRCEGEIWTYRFPKEGCVAERDMLLLTVVDGRVTGAQHEHQYNETPCPTSNIPTSNIPTSSPLPSPKAGREEAPPNRLDSPS